MAPKPTKEYEWLETPTGNKISKRHQIQSTQHLLLDGKNVISPEVVIRGDLVEPPSSRTRPTSTASAPAASQPAVAFKIGRYVFISPRCVLKPPSKLNSGYVAREGPLEYRLHHYRMSIGNVVYIGPDSYIEAGEIGSHVHIGANVTVGNFVMIRDYVKVLDNAILPPFSIWPSFSIVAGNPARVVGQVGDGWGFLEHGPGGVQEARNRWSSVGPCQRTGGQQRRG